MKIALAMIVRGTDAEAALLARCLGNMSPYVDGIFITRTHEPNKPSNKAVGDVAKQYKAKLSDFEWCDDFAAARNFNFSQVSTDYDYILWSDADDMWRGLEKLKAIVEKNPSVDGFGFWYLYDWDEARRPVVVHRKTMMVKNNGCVTWKGRVHEDLMETREVEIKLVDGIDRLHITNEVRSKQSAERNLVIADKAQIENPDDPRSQWNLANAQLMVGHTSAALESFTEFIKRSGSDEEKYIALERMAEAYRNTGNALEAIRTLQLAVGLRPRLPDAYFILAHVYFSIGNMDKAEEYSLMGLKLPPQPNRMIVYNPRDYDYNPMMLLARVYFQKNRPELMLPLLKGCLRIYPKDKNLQQMVKDGDAATKKLARVLEQVKLLRRKKTEESLVAAIQKLPVDVRSHPAVCALRNQKVIKRNASGKDLVYYCGNTAQKWNGETFKTEGIGGSEEAVVNLSEEWIKAGWNVTVYNNCGHKEVKCNGVVYKPFWEFNVRDKQDVIVLWRSPRYLDVPMNADTILLDMHDAIASGEFTPERVKRVTKVMLKSKFHRSLYPQIPDEKVHIVPNGFKSYPSDVKKDPYLIINTSSPDRSLDVLPKLFKEVKKCVPKAKMKWAYGWDGFKNGYASDSVKMKWMEDTIKEMKAAGIESLGRISQEEVGHLYQQAQVLAYPTEFAEISCISVLKAQAAGCIPVTTDFAALDESNVFGVKIHSPKTKDTWSQPYQFHFGLEGEMAQKEWVNAVVKTLKAPKMPDATEWAKMYNWATIAKHWL